MIFEVAKTVLAGETITEAQIDSLAEGLTVASASHATLLAGRQPAASAGPGTGADSSALFSELQAAVAAFDPGATELIDQLIASQAPGSELAAKLGAARELLDNFNFGDAEPLLAEIEQGLQA